MSIQYDLFTTNSQTAGYRLHYLEVFNWGTFHNRIYRIAPKGNNSLLTGANASGKSTLIDALLTVLVPAKKDRFYNQSSGNEKKGDRTEETYVLGNYGNIQSEGESSTKTQQLRDKSTYSVLLATFENNYQDIVTLFQVRWFINAEMKCTYGFSTRPLTIQTDFAGFNGSRGDWKKTLEQKYNKDKPRRQIEFYDTIKDYKDRMIHAFGFRSDKAVPLFNQIVGVKVLNDLDDFIRNNMLEQRDAEAEYMRLNNSFSTLIEAKTKIEKVKEQIAQLEPIDKEAKQLSDINDTLRHLQETREMAVYWFAQKNVELADKQLTELNAQLKIMEQKLDTLTTEKDHLQQQEIELKLAIANDEVGQQITKLKQEISDLDMQKKSRQDNLQKYNQLVIEVGLTDNPTKEAFDDNRHRALSEKEECQKQYDAKNEELRLAKNKTDEINKSINDNQETLQSLKKNKNNISGRVAEIRDMILQQVGATPEEIPFIGELIQVKFAEKQWENPIEKILHNLALRLIVPKCYYTAVNKFINSNNLKGRIVYQQYDGEVPSSIPGFRKLPENGLLNKLEFNQKSEYAAWIKDIIAEHYNYSCVESLDEFNNYQEKAVTREGLIKSVRGKHEKDDRPHVNTRENYVLGWDNREKIAAIMSSVRKLQEQQTKNLGCQQEIKTTIRVLERQKDRFDDIVKLYSQFDDINWEESAQMIQEKTEKKQELEATNDKVNALQQHLEDVERKLDKLENDTIKAIDRRIFKLEEEIKAGEKRRSEHSILLESLNTTVDTTGFETCYAEHLDVNYENIESKQKAFQSMIQQHEKENNARKNQTERTVTSLIMKFKNPPEEITARYKDWRSDVHALPEAQNIHLIGEYQKFYSKLVDEDLVRHEKKFDEYLQETVTIKVADFRMFFKKWEDSIKESIAMLNKSLKEINFNSAPDTYIQLVNVKKNNIDSIDFKRELDNAMPNLHDINATIDGRKAHFENRIQPLIEHLRDESWRKRVMDVRNWFTYKAEEFFAASDQKYKTYESMGQLSGGEKAQLTYTILGSAIAYQFGLTKDGLQPNSFRFIAIDEAFKAQDEDKARYLISLCEQLHLQLLVVTPSDNIHIVEDNISFVHFVQRHGNESRLYDMPIQTFKTERQKFLNQVQ